MPTLPRQYADDYAGWIEDTARAIEDGRFSEIDRTALADEVRDLGRTERRELRRALEALFVQMLKARYRSERQMRGDELTIQIQRNHIAEFLRDSPSLRGELAEFIESAYGNARLQAADESGLELDVFPESCEWTIGDMVSV